MHRSAPGLPASDRPPRRTSREPASSDPAHVLGRRPARPCRAASPPGRALVPPCDRLDCGDEIGRSRWFFSAETGSRPPRPALKTIQLRAIGEIQTRLRLLRRVRSEPAADQSEAFDGSRTCGRRRARRNRQRWPTTAARCAPIASSTAATSPASVSIKYGPSTTLDSPMPRRSIATGRDGVLARRSICAFQTRALVEIRAATHHVIRRTVERTPRCARRHPTKLALKLVILYKVGNTPGRFVDRRKDDSTN